MAEHPGRDDPHGTWWPQSRDLAVELADLVDHFPLELGRISRALFSPPDWNPAPRKIRAAHGYVKVGSFPRDDTHLMRLTMSDRTVLRLLVVPPGLTPAQGAAAMQAADGRGHDAGDAAPLLDAESEIPNVDPGDSWNDDGGSWQGPPPPVAPFTRTVI
jgi:hypothetical protein